MNKEFTPMAKIVILLVLATIFATSMVALSLRAPDRESRDHSFDREDRGYTFDKDTKRYTHTFDAIPGGTIKIDTDLGDVTVTAGDVAAVEVVVDVRGDEDEVDEFQVKFGEVDDDMQVRGRSRRNRGWHFDWGDIDVRFDVTVPREINVRIETSGGDITVSGVTGFLRAETSGGDLTLSDHTGEVQMETSGGEIHFTDIQGYLRTETSGGDIKGERVTGDVHVETSGGDIILKMISGKTHASTSGGDVRLGMLDNQGVEASTSGGDITISLPEDTPADIFAETMSGNVRCDFPIRGTMDDGSLEGEINGGGKRVRAETSGGRITIRSTR